MVIIIIIECSMINNLSAIATRGFPCGSRGLQYRPESVAGATMRKLLIIDDDEGLIGPLRQYFARFDLSLDSEIHPLEGIEKLKQQQYDLLILDVMLPGIDGFEACRRIRQFSDLPIIMLTARGEVMDRVVGLEIGADDYLPKPFEPRELVARIQNLFKRSASHHAERVYRFGDMILDLDKKQLSRGNNEVAVTSAEFGLLSLLLQNQDRVLSRDEIMQAMRGIDADIYSRAIDVLVSRLRQKLAKPELIRTVRGQGYQFVNR